MTIDRGFIQGGNFDPAVKAAFLKVCDALDTAVVVSGVTATSTELNAVVGQPASVTTAATPASGTVGVQFVFKDGAGAALAHAISGRAFFSSSTGLAYGTATSAVTLTNGAWLDDVAGKTATFITDATGKLGVTVTAGAGSYYISFQLPNGKIVTSSALVVN